MNKYKTFIIYLEDNELSCDLAHALLKDLSKNKIYDPYLFKGTNAQCAVEESKNKKILKVLPDKDGKIDTPDSEKNTRLNNSHLPGVLGCFSSHYKLWQKCVDLNEDIIIFEDDVIIYNDLIEVGDFEDILILSVNSVWEVGHYYVMKLLYKSTDLNPIDYRWYYMPGTSGYIIKPKAARILLDYYKDKIKCADHSMNQSLVNLKIISPLVGRDMSKLEKPSTTAEVI